VSSPPLFFLVHSTAIAQLAGRWSAARHRKLHSSNELSERAWLGVNAPRLDAYQKRWPHLQTTASLPSPETSCRINAYEHPGAGHHLQRGLLLTKFSSIDSLNRCSRSLSSYSRCPHTVPRSCEMEMCVCVCARGSLSRTRSLMISVSSITMRHFSLPVMPWHVINCAFSLTWSVK